MSKKKKKNMSEKKKKIKGAAVGKKARKTGKKKAPKAAIAAALAVVILAAAAGGVYFYIGKRAEMSKTLLDEQVSRLYDIGDRGRDAWNKFIRGEMMLPDAFEYINKDYEESEKICGNLKAVRTYNRELDLAKRNAEDFCRATSVFMFSLATSVHFRVLGNIDEGTQNQQTAVRLDGEVKRLGQDYFNGKRQAGLDAPPRPVKDDSRYVFIILMDAARSDHLGCYGYKRRTSPGIDKIAREGMLFENAFSQCDTTDTSVASLFSSLYPRSHKMIGTSDWLWETSLIDRFRKAGFATGGFSANSLIAKESHFDAGFDYFEELFWNPATITFGEAERWIDRARTKNDKIFTYIHLIDPHDIYFAPMPFTDFFNRGAPLGLTAFSLNMMTYSYFKVVAKQYPECNYDPTTQNWDKPELLLSCLSKLQRNTSINMDSIRNMIDFYDAEIHYVDFEIQRFMDYLQENGMLRNSTIVVMADHGESFLEHNQSKHGRVLFDNEIHVPLIFWRGDRNFGGRRVSKQVEVIDIMPTLLAMIGAKPPEGVHGRDIISSPPPSDPIFSLSWNGSDILTGDNFRLSTVREPGFKYILTTPAGKDTFLYDEFFNLKKDPGELTDARKEFPEDFKRLKAKLEWWNKATETVAHRTVRSGADASKVKKLKQLGYIK
jgi:arylsulfatase A-like enzyme